MNASAQDAERRGGTEGAVDRAGRGADGPPPSIVHLTSADGARSHARLFEPPAGTAPTAVAVCLPAMAVEAAYYDPLGRALAALGVVAMVTELRGIGSSSLRAARGVNFGYRELTELDVGAAVAAARDRFPDVPVVLVGHSLGGHLAVLFSALRPRELDGIALIAAGTPYFRGYAGRRRAYVLAGAILLPAVSAVLGYLPGRALGFGGREARRLIAEWAGVIRTGRFRFAGQPADLEAALAAVRLPVLAVSLDEDTLAPHAATDHLASMLPGAALTRRRTARGELGDKIDHFRWVRRPEPVAAIVAAWLGSLGRGPS